MDFLFYVHSSLAVIAMGWAMATRHAIHALLFAIFSLLNLAVAMYTLSAPLAAALEVIVYAGAIMVLFVFVVMLIKIEPDQDKTKFKSTKIFAFFVPLIFLFDCAIVLHDDFSFGITNELPAQQIAVSLIGENGFLLEMISFVLLAGLIAAIFLAAGLRKNERLN